MKELTQSVQLENRAPLNRLTHPWFLALAMSALLGAQVTVLADEHDPKIESATKGTYVFRKMLKSNNLEAKSKDGIVTLTGKVDTESQSQLAQATTSGVEGVKGVQNHIVVNDDHAYDSDTGRFMRLTTALSYHRSAASAGTVAEIKDGIVKLTGKAANEAERNMLTEYAKDVVEIKDVKNEMTLATEVKPSTGMMESIDDASIAAQVQMALLAHRSTSKIPAAATSADGVVTLTGQAKDKSESAGVEKLVLDINGVKQVVNNLTVKQNTEASN